MDSKEIQERLEIIKIAININDTDTILLQTTHLKKANSIKIDEIVKLLSGRNFRQALYLIKTYNSKSDYNLNISDTDSSDTKKVLNIEDMIKMNPLAKETTKEYKSTKYTQDNSRDYNDNRLVKNSPLEKIEETQEEVKQDETEVLSKYKALREKFAKKDKKEALDRSPIYKNLSDEVKNVDEKFENTDTLKEPKKIKQEAVKKLDKTPKENNKTENSNLENNIYPPIPNIEQKLKQAFILYPPNKESEVLVEVVVQFLKYLSLNSYTNRDIKGFLSGYDLSLEKNDTVKASQILLLAAITDSKYAQFIFARELFNGKVLKKDLKKSYVIMKNLANSLYPDAICDLAQFYEYGIGTQKNKKIAIRLYEKAFELGVDRASKHIARIKKSKGVLSSLVKLISN